MMEAFNIVQDASPARGSPATARYHHPARLPALTSSVSTAPRRDQVRHHRDQRRSRGIKIEIGGAPHLGLRRVWPELKGSGCAGGMLCCAYKLCVM